MTTWQYKFRVKKTPVQIGKTVMQKYKQTTGSKGKIYFAYDFLIAAIATSVVMQ